MTGGKIRGGMLQADGRVTVGEYLDIESTAVEGQMCPKTGIQSKNNLGAPLTCQCLTPSCQSGVWKGASASLGEDTYQTGIGPGGGWVPMDCPPGYVMTGMTAPMGDYKL